MKKIYEDVLDDIQEIRGDVPEETGNPAEGWGHVLIFNAQKECDPTETVDFLDSYLSVHADSHCIFPAPEGSVPEGFFNSGDMWVICFEASEKDIPSVYFGILAACPMAVGRASVAEDGRFSPEIPLIAVHAKMFMQENVLKISDQCNAASDMKLLAGDALDYWECVTFLKKIAKRKLRRTHPEYA